MADRVPFGFRKDIEDKPEDDVEGVQEVSCTALRESKVWFRAPFVPASPNDAPTWRRW